MASFGVALFALAMVTAGAIGARPPRERTREREWRGIDTRCQLHPPGHPECHMTQWRRAA
jgi:hypothetical protein